MSEWIEKNVAPWPCYRGNEIIEGCTITHPRDGLGGTVVYLCEYEDLEDQWRVDYGDGALSRLCLQIGDKGMAHVNLENEAK